MTTLIDLADYADMRPARPRSLRGADIYIFTGVRYERIEDELPLENAVSMAAQAELRTAERRRVEA